MEAPPNLTRRATPAASDTPTAKASLGACRWFVATRERLPIPGRGPDHLASTRAASPRPRPWPARSIRQALDRSLLLLLARAKLRHQLLQLSQLFTREF